MRGGAIPIFAWAALLAILFAGNWIWDEHAVNVAEAAFAALVIFASGLALLLRSRDAVRRGPPGTDARPLAVPESSFGAALVGIAFGSILFGLVWASFLVLFGLALLLAASGRLVLEARAQHDSVRRCTEPFSMGEEAEP